MSFLSSLTGSKKAANAAINAADINRTQARDDFNYVENAYSPYIQGGNQANTVLQNIAGLNGQGAADAAFGQFQTSPGYQWRFNEGMRGLDNSYAARTGGTLSGGLIKAAENYGQNQASNEYGNWVNQLNNLNQGGMQATGAVSNARLGTGQSIMGSNTAAGNATANAALADGSFLSNLAGGAMRLAGTAGFNPLQSFNPFQTQSGASFGRGG